MEADYPLAVISLWKDVNSGYNSNILRLFQQVFAIFMTNFDRSNVFAKEHEVTLLLESGKSNLSLISLVLIDQAVTFLSRASRQINHRRVSQDLIWRFKRSVCQRDAGEIVWDKVHRKTDCSVLL